MYDGKNQWIVHYLLPVTSVAMVTFHALNDALPLPENSKNWPL